MVASLDGLLPFWFTCSLARRCCCIYESFMG